MVPAGYKAQFCTLYNTKYNTFQKFPADIYQIFTMKLSFLCWVPIESLTAF